MPCTLRSCHRVLVCCLVTYQVGNFEDYGTVWNCSYTTWQSTWLWESRN